jgi:hypothetical protein
VRFEVEHSSGPDDRFFGFTDPERGGGAGGSGEASALLSDIRCLKAKVTR